MNVVPKVLPYLWWCNPFGGEVAAVVLDKEFDAKSSAIDTHAKIAQIVFVD